MSKKKWIISGIAIVAVAAAAYFSFGSHGSSEDKTITVGRMSATKQDDEVWDVIEKQAKDKYGINVKVKYFTDYSQPNKALTSGDVDVNAFQHYAFLNAYNKKNGTDIKAIGKTVISPIHLYSTQYKSVSDFQNGDTIVVPNDPSNESRALKVLKYAGLIDLKDGDLVTVKDITKNPKNLTIKELSADQTARSINDVQGAVVNQNYASTAKLSEKQAIFTEPFNKDSEQWVNIIAANKKDANKKLYKDFVKAYQSDAVKKAIKKAYGDASIPAWDRSFN
ncbi:ABC-type metal ion transport system [Fructobacillus fructosus]|uniref:Lipoprotein n=1 Tax=Fructobacillus fructosus TaxID=1631 RepID=A0ABM9MT13_9LACO|nr:MetQ/NlpA family ABC transporter substrate-binding protein [Fructobacillus fructosus]KRN51928.1 ABC-type metal ion transport system, periplasmic component surface antigen [Fructobacillus fructosus KCTC 3544]MCK8638602.1 MetQ/NlpA family ABC transporter substrate-binding protein [Fructobacillus fructosus]CAK1238054.1 ABC-type metal ion transport system [Fructobacillus fructosus]CAK1239038.1 ABC-type metal ion transport system [Fructobacillus fructosus]CAK1241708.1 ABC-type metal ion transpor